MVLLALSIKYEAKTKYYKEVIMIRRVVFPFAWGFVLFIFSSAVFAIDYAGVNVPDVIKYGGENLKLNGVGQRSKYFVKLYVASLYLAKKNKKAEQIIAEDSAMAIRLAITSSYITPEKMKEITLKGFEKSTKGNTTGIKPQIDELVATFKKGVGVGDVYELINMPGGGVHILRNGVRVAQIKSLAFKQALFGIWLSKSPIQRSLKRSLLGK